MAEKDKIRLLRGLEADIPAALPSGCPAFSTDTHKLFIGTGAGRKEIAGADFVPVVSAMPPAAEYDTKTVCYNGASTTKYKKGHLYIRDTTTPSSYKVNCDATGYASVAYSPEPLNATSKKQLYTDEACTITIYRLYATATKVFYETTEVGTVTGITPQYKSWEETYKDEDKYIPAFNEMPDVYTEKSQIISYVGESTSSYKKGHLYHKKVAYEVMFYYTVGHAVGTKYSPNNLEGLSERQRLYNDSALTIPATLYADHEKIYDSPDCVRDAIGTILSISEQKKWEDSYKELAGEYLTINGGTMTGGIKFDMTTGNEICKGDNDGSLTLCGGKDIESGAYIDIGGANADGQVVLHAYNGTDDSDLIVKPDGTATVNGKTLATQNDLVNKIDTAGEGLTKTGTTMKVTPNTYLKCADVNSMLQSFYDGIFPVGTTLPLFQWPSVPSGVNATWTDVSNEYNNRYFMGSGEKAANTYQNESLPNITGKIAGLAPDTDPVDWGVLRKGSKWGNISNYVFDGAPGLRVDAISWFNFSANGSNGTYQDGAMVKPYTVTMKVYRRTA